MEHISSSINYISKPQLNRASNDSIVDYYEFEIPLRIISDF